MTESGLNRRTFIAGAAGVAASLPVSGLSLAQSAPARIGVGSDPVFSAFFLAMHEKMFQAENVNAVLQIYSDGGEAMNALVAQQVDLAAASEPTTLVRLNRAEIRPLAVVYESGSYLKMVVGKHIKDAASIKKFGMVPGSISDYLARVGIAKLGLNAAAVELVRSGPPELPALLTRGDIDAFFAWEPWPSMAVDQGARVQMTCGEAGYNNTIWLNSSAALLERDRATVQGILRVLAKASSIVQKEPGRAAAAVRAVTRIPEATTLKVLKDMTAVVRDFSDADYQTFDTIAQFLADQKVTPAVVPFRNYMQRGFFKV